MDALVKKIRSDNNHKEQPTYAIIDSQSVKTTPASNERYIDS